MAANLAARDGRREQRAFLAVQAGKAAVGALLCGGFIALFGKPDPYEAVAMAGLMAPLLLAVLGWGGFSRTLLEQAGLGLSALLIGYLAALTGGLSSPLLVWLVLVPVEAALTGGRGAVLGGSVLAALVLAALAGLEYFARLPLSRLSIEPWMATGVSLAAALMQAGLLAVAAQGRQRASDAAAAQGATMYRFLADHAMDLITRHALDGRICFASPSSDALLGRAPAEIEGLLLSDLVHAPDGAALEAALETVRRRSQPAEVEVRLKRLDGTLVWSDIRLQPARETGGDALEIVAVTRDISQRKAQEAALVEARDAAMEASRAKSRFLANMSHELRTPLNAIIGFSEIMSREMFGTLGNPRYQEYARLVHESGSHLLELINGVLDMSKIEAGKFEISPEVFGLEEVADSAVRFVRLAAERAGVVLKTEIGRGARQIYADKRAVKQILVNLLSNGIKFTPAGGEVRISAGLDGAGVMIAVSDTGTGISRADLDRLGQPFEQVDGEHTRTKEGTGLGLALVKALAQLHGGEARLISALGQGTVVTLRLPHAAVGADGAPLTSHAAGANVVSLRGAA